MRALLLLALSTGCAAPVAALTVADGTVNMLDDLAGGNQRQLRERDTNLRAQARSYLGSAIRAARDGNCGRVATIRNAARALPLTSDGASVYAEVFANSPQLDACSIHQLCIELRADPELGEDPRLAQRCGQ